MSAQPTAGEMMVGAYLKKVERCELVAYGQHSPEEGEQMEVDVIGIRPKGREEIIACEVATHLRGLNYGNKEKSQARLNRKFRDTERHVTGLFDPENSFRFQFWSPIVRSGLVEMLTNLADSFEKRHDNTLELVINEDYTEKIELLEKVAGSTAAQDNELAFRFLQILQHLRGR